MNRAHDFTGFHITIMYVSDMPDWKKLKNDTNNYFLTMETTTFRDPLLEEVVTLNIYSICENFTVTQILEKGVEPFNDMTYSGFLDQIILKKS